MPKQDIANFETQLQKLCEFWRQKLTHAELVGVLDTVKMGYHIRTIQSFEEPEIAAPILDEKDTSTNKGSPLPAAVAHLKHPAFEGPVVEEIKDA